MSSSVNRVKNRVRFRFAGLEIEFVDREKALKQVFEWSEKGTWNPIVVFGPEGCGKTAWLRQSVEILKDLGYSVIYFNPMMREFIAEVKIEDIKQRALEVLKRSTSGYTLARFAWSVVDFAREVIRLGRKRLAIIIDDAFQFIGSKEASFIVKGMLELIEYPPENYDRIIAIAATSEGFSRVEIGRHRWADIMPMWNMSRKGFEELYEQVHKKSSGLIPSFEDIWRLTGGNPEMLENLVRFNWVVDRVVERIIKSKKLESFTASLSIDEKKWLLESVEDPDTLFTRERMSLLNKLVELNLVIDDIPWRKEYLWIDEPPLEKDLELGVGKLVAWQTPLHREAVKRVLKESIS